MVQFLDVYHPFCRYQHVLAINRLLCILKMRFSLKSVPMSCALEPYVYDWKKSPFLWCLWQVQNVERAKLALATDDQSSTLYEGERQSDHLLMVIAYSKWERVLKEVGYWCCLFLCSNSFFLVFFWTFFSCQNLNNWSIRNLLIDSLLKKKIVSDFFFLALLFSCFIPSNKNINFLFMQNGMRAAQHFCSSYFLSSSVMFTLRWMMP